MATPNLEIPHIFSSQGTKEVTANQSADRLDLPLTDLEAISFTDADFTLTSTQALQNLYFDCSGAITADRNLIVPGNRKIYIVKNGTSGGFNLVVKTAAGAGVTVANGATKTVYCTGTDVVVTS